MGGEECHPIRNDHPNQEGGVKIGKSGFRVRGDILAVIRGAIGGSIFVLFATKAIPKMMAQMRAKGYSPDIRADMMKGFDEAQPERTTR